MRIAIANVPLFPNDVPKNLGMIRRILDKYAEKQVDMFLFAENNLMGGFWKQYRDMIPSLCKSWSINRITREIERISADYDSSVCCGCIEFDGCYYVTHFISRAGHTIGRQRKLYPQNPAREPFFQSGTGITNILYNQFRIHILACCNYNFPEVAVMSTLEQPDIVLCPTDTYVAAAHEINVTTTYLKARALDTGAAVFCCFGDSDSVAEKVMAVAAYNGKGEEQALYMKTPGQSQVTIVDIVLKKAKQVWGGAAARENLLREYLLRRAYDANGEVVCRRNGT